MKSSKSMLIKIGYKGVARIFQRESHWVIQRVLTRLSPEYCRLFAYNKAYKGGEGGHGNPRTPPGYALGLSKPFFIIVNLFI